MHVGNCSAPPPDEDALGLPPAAARLRPLLPGQCLIVTDGDTIYMNGGGLWLDNVYMRLRRSTREQFAEFIQVATSSQLWIANSTFQGDGNGVQDCDACGIRAGSTGGLYVEGTVPHTLLVGKHISVRVLNEPGMNMLLLFETCNSSSAPESTGNEHASYVGTNMFPPSELTCALYRLTLV